MAGTALADATVGYVPGPPAGLTITTPAGGGLSGYGLSIKPDTASDLVDPITVGQLALGDPAITSSSADCHRNFFANSETCAPGPFRSIDITLDNFGVDEVQFVHHSDLPGGACIAQPSSNPTIQLTADLGPSNGTFSVETLDNGSTACPGGTEPGLAFLDPILDIHGGSGRWF